MAKASAKINFTDKWIKKIVPPTKGRATHADSQQKYLRLQVTPNGTKTFYYLRKIFGRPRNERLGAYGDIDLPTARQMCVDYSSAIGRGEDPTAPKKKDHSVMQEVWDTYYELHAEPNLKSAKNYKTNWTKYLAPKLAKRRLADITPLELKTMHVGLIKGVGLPTANKAFRVLSSCFSWAIENNIAMINPVAFKFPKEDPRCRYLHESEVGEFFKVVNAYHSQQIQDFIYLCLFSAQRRHNVLKMEWKNIDFDMGLWFIAGKDFKNKRNQGVYLPEQALAILKRRKEFAPEGNPWVFPSHGATGHLVEPKKAWDTIRKDAKVPDLHIHDLRHTVASWMSADGANMKTIGRALGHRALASTDRYTHLDLDPVRSAVDSALGKMMTAAAPVLTLVKPEGEMDEAANA